VKIQIPLMTRAMPGVLLAPTLWSGAAPAAKAAGVVGTSRGLPLVVTAVLGILATGQVQAQPPSVLPPGKSGLAFQGYWMGIDPLDGGDSRRSIVRLSNGRFAMAGRDTALTLCDDTDRGFISFDDGVAAGKNVLQSDSLTIACSNTGASVVLRVQYELAGDGEMVEHTTTLGGSPVSRIVLHRVSDAAPAGALAAPVPPGKAPRGFQGYWMGIDPVDGGDARRSLVRLPNGRFAMAARDSALTLCDGTDRGLGTFDDGLLTGGVLISNNLTLRCFNNGLSVVLHVRYELAAAGLMLEHTTRDDGTPVGTIVFHKLSVD